MSGHAPTRQWFASFDVPWRTVSIWLAVTVLEVYAVAAYFALTPDSPTGDLRYLFYPLVWMNAGVWAVVRANPDTGNWRHRALGVAVAVAYFLAVLYVPGKLGPGAAGAAVAVRVEMAAPGWGPLVAVTSPWVRAFLVPFEVVGYAALSYLVYANVLRFSRRTLSGVLGLATCVGCTVPILAPLVGAFGGPTAGLTTTAYAWSYDLGTVVFLLTLGLLYWSQRTDA